MSGEIFKLEQIRRAAEIGVGVRSPSRIKLVPLNEESVKITEELENILQNQGVTT